MELPAPSWVQKQCTYLSQVKNFGTNPQISMFVEFRSYFVGSGWVFWFLILSLSVNICVFLGFAPVPIYALFTLPDALTLTKTHSSQCVCLSVPLSVCQVMSAVLSVCC